MKHTRNKNDDMMKHMQLWYVILVPVVALIMGAAFSKVLASGHHRWVSFDEAEIFFEYNSTDQDLGLHIFFDAEGWEEIEVKGPDGEIFEVENDGSLSKIGSTEVFTESAEPPLCDKEDPEECTEVEIEAAIEAFQALFPEGKYRFRGKTVEGKRLRGSAYLSHELPTPPVITNPNPEDPDLEGFLDNPTVKWELDTEIEEYEVVAEMVIDGHTFVNTATLRGGSTMFTVSPEFTNLAKAAKDAGTLEEFKVEVIARADNLNKTITELVVFEMEEE